MKNIRPQYMTRKMATAVPVTPVTKLSRTRAWTRKNGNDVFQLTRSSGARSMPCNCMGTRFAVRELDASLPTGR